MTEKDINQALLSAGGQMPDPLCGGVERPCKNSEKDKQENKINRSNIYIYILGSIGNTARQNRDNMRIFDRRGQCPTLKSHISKESIMVIRKWKI
jgi:hypothetical protein